MENIDILQHIFKFIHPFHLRGCYLSSKYIHNYIELIKNWMIKRWCYNNYYKEANKLSFKQIVEASLFYTPLLVKQNNHSIISLFHNECRNIYNGYRYSKDAINWTIRQTFEDISKVNQCGNCEECLKISTIMNMISIMLYCYQIWDKLFLLSSHKSIFSAIPKLLYSIYEYKSGKQLTYPNNELIMDIELIHSHMFDIKEKCEIIIIAYKLNPCEYNSLVYNCLIGKEDLSDDISVLRKMCSGFGSDRVQELLNKYTGDLFIPYEEVSDLEVNDCYLFRSQYDLKSKEYWYYHNLINIPEYIFLNNYQKDELCEFLLTIDNILMYIICRDNGYPVPKYYHSSGSFFVKDLPPLPLK